MDKFKITNQLAKAIGGNAWIKSTPDGEIKIARVYDPKRGYAQINDDGVNIDKLTGHWYRLAQEYLISINVKTYRA